MDSEAPKRRGRPRKTAVATSEVPVTSAVAVKRRGRPRKVVKAVPKMTETVTLPPEVPKIVIQKVRAPRKKVQINTASPTPPKITPPPTPIPNVIPLTPTPAPAKRETCKALSESTVERIVNDAIQRVKLDIAHLTVSLMKEKETETVMPNYGDFLNSKGTLLRTMKSTMIFNKILKRPIDFMMNILEDVQSGRISAESVGDLEALGGRKMEIVRMGDSEIHGTGAIYNVSVQGPMFAPKVRATVPVVMKNELQYWELHYCPTMEPPFMIFRRMNSRGGDVEGEMDSEIMGAVAMANEYIYEEGETDDEE